MLLRTNKMRVGKWPLRHSASNFCGVGLRGGGVRDVLGPATPGSHWTILDRFLVPASSFQKWFTHIPYLGNWKLFPGHEFCHHLKGWVYSFLSKSFDICPLWLEYSLGRILLISWKFCLGKSLPLCLWLMKCISLGRDHKPCRKGNFSLQCTLDICLRWILIFLYQEFWQPPLAARNSSPVVTFEETFPQ